MTKMVYFFGGGKAEGNASMKDLLGGKGANLAEMTNLGIPVPPGFTISTEVCELYYAHGQRFPDGLQEEVELNLHRLETLLEKKFGNPDNPLLVSVRSGAAVSMPGMMDTVLNLGMNDKVVEGLSAKTGNPRFAWDAYRRFIQMFGNVVKHVSHDSFEHILEKKKLEKGVSLDTQLEVKDLIRIVEEYKKEFRNSTGEEFPQDPKQQLWEAIAAVFRSWNNERAIRYRQIHNIKNLKGTAVTVQTMVFGNFGLDSGTGVCFSRDPSTGKKEFYGEYLMNAQGEDVVAGIRTPEPLDALKRQNPELYNQLVAFKDLLEAHYKDMQDIEFTVEKGKLYILQTRSGKRTGTAAVKIAVDMAKETIIDKKTAILRVTPEQLDQVLHPMIDPKVSKNAKPIAKGLNASPGAAAGQIVFTSEDAENWAKEGKKVILVRKETSPDDIGGMYVSEGVLTSTGGLTSHAAVVARGMGKPCIVGAKDILVDSSVKKITVYGKELAEGAWLTIDGSTGNIFEGQLSLIPPILSEELQTLLNWADEIRKEKDPHTERPKGLQVRANADIPEDAEKARRFGAEGIGLCRTEHMFFDKGKLEIFQEMIVAENKESRQAALRKLLPLQKEDFKGIFRAMNGFPVTIRLLDPPLHEFVPHSLEDIKALAETLHIPVERLRSKAESLKEMNPMLGMRGCRLGIVYPEIYEMQVEAIALAIVEVRKEGIHVLPEIMIPLVGTYKELSILREQLEKKMLQILPPGQIEYKIGTMIEIPRAALTTEEIAPYADFFSFGTNDLTQMTFGYSRDDVGSFLPYYLEQKILEEDPFKTLDRKGVGQLVSLAISNSRAVKKSLKYGMCGEHGGDPSSIEFFHSIGGDYVSCSPFRVPIARLTAAQVALRLPRG
ncbi:MAG: pyruvate, phosphate dikinase [Spirochaetes bacterium]|nr:pyruvate, phosphate dikinase [Spirochaetota bacterium]